MFTVECGIVSKVSYDVYLWHQAVGDIDEVLDSLAEGEDLSRVVPHEAVRAFRRELSTMLPQLRDVTEPVTGSRSDAELRYVILTLPYGWLDLLPQVLDLAAIHGLSGWDPQLDEPIGRQAQRPEQLRGAVSSRDVTMRWTAKQLSGLGVGVQSITRAWAFAGLPEAVTFGEAVGVFILAMTMRDGAKVDHEEAVRAINEVAVHCADGVPHHDCFVSIGFTITDVAGFAETVAQGRY